MKDPHSNMMFNIGWMAGLAFGFIAGLVVGHLFW